MQVFEHPSMQESEHPSLHVLVHVAAHPEHVLDLDVPVHELQQPEAHSAVQSEQAGSFWHEVNNGSPPLKVIKPIRGKTVFEVCLKNSLLLYNVGVFI